MTSPSEIKQLFVAEGLTVADWARKHGFPASLVYRVLRGETQCLRGTTHEIGIALGLKRRASDEMRRILPGLLSHGVTDDAQFVCDRAIKINHPHTNPEL